MSLRSLSNRIFTRVLRPLLVKFYSFFTAKTYDMVFGAELRKWKPDIIHAHDGVTQPTAGKAAKKIGAKLVYDCHELETHRSPPMSTLRRLQVSRMERKYLPQADIVITVTERIADYLAHEYKIKRPLVLFNSPPSEQTSMPGRWNSLDRFDIRSDLLLNPRIFLFVYTGNVTLNRGLELAIVAISKLQGYRDPNGKFKGAYHLATLGNPQSGQEDVIIPLAKSLGVTLHMLPPVAPNKVASYISTANASIIPILPATLSYEYAMPNKLFEAAMSGNPIIGSDLIEMGPFIENEGLGLTYKADSPDDCAEKMMYLIDNYEKFHRDAERQHKFCMDYAWEAQEKKLLAMYEEMLSEN